MLIRAPGAPRESPFRIKGNSLRKAALRAGAKILLKFGLQPPLPLPPPKGRLRDLLVATQGEGRFLFLKFRILFIITICLYIKEKLISNCIFIHKLK